VAGQAPGAEAPNAELLQAAGAADPAAVLDRIAANFEAPPGARAFAWELVSQICERGESLDLMIAARASNWRISRMALVDRNVLRLGAYELAHTDTAPAIVLDEAVELARRYGSETSPAFVNGILDALAKSLREGAA
jgi:N utilization substance protein B